MMYAVYKYPLYIRDEQELVLPICSRILSVEVQQQTIVLYALVELETPGKSHGTVYIRGTGHECDGRISSAAFIGTVKMLEGALMYHVFYKEGYEEVNNV